MMSEESNKKVDPAEQVAAESAAESAAEGVSGETESDVEPKEKDVAAEQGETPDAAEESKPSEEESSANSEPDWKDMYARTLADFDNYRKRAVRDREELVKFATSEAVKDMIPTVDTLALALDQAKDKADDPFVKGVQLAYDGFLKALKEHGAEPFDSVGEVLDPNRHEAIATLPSDTVEEGKISTEVKRGWMLNGRLLRAAQVVVSSGKADK